MTITTKTDTGADKGDPKVPTSQPVPEVLNLELSDIGRYMFGGTLYVKDTVYQFDLPDAKNMLRLRAPNGTPVFMLARKRTRTIRVEVDADDSRVPVVPVMDEQTRRLSSVFNLVQDGKVVTPPTPKGALDLGDDGDDVAQRLAQIDAGEIDTGADVVRV